MNLKCLICSDLFTPTSDIHVTRCGHLFHYLCLSQWLERSHTCPQCRCRTTDKNIHKLYLSVEENPETTDLSTLQNKLDNLQFENGVKENRIKKVNEKCDALSTQNVGLREEIKELENKVRILDSAMHALKEQIAFFKTKSKDKQKLEEEVNRLKNKLKDMEFINVVVHGRQEEVNDMLRNNRDPHSLSILVSTLKKELIDSDKKKKHIQGMLKDVQKQSSSYKTELTQLNKQNNKLQQEVIAHKQCEAEKAYLKSKIEELGLQKSKDTSDTLNISIRRIITESPAPLPKIKNKRTEDKKNDSPSVTEKVQEIKDSDSPYLRVQSSSIGLSQLINYNTKFVTTSKPSSSNTSNNNQFSIFKQPSFKLNIVNAPPAEVSYDGMGGHSKDDGFFEREMPRTATKRPRSTSTISTAKFRKLAPVPQKKLHDFFENSQSGN